MLKLKTTSNFWVPVRRGTLNVIVRMVIHSVTFDTNNIIVKGNYYYKDENGNDNLIVDGEINLLKTKESLSELQSILPELESSTDIFSNVDQRTKDFAYAILTLEAGLNYGTVASDWVIDNDVFEIEPEQPTEE